jgi:hypothetical protein
MDEAGTKGNRYERFRAALDYRGVTLMAWAKAAGVTRGHLYAVLNGSRESQKLLDAVEQFTESAEHAMATDKTMAAA